MYKPKKEIADKSKKEFADKFKKRPKNWRDGGEYYPINQNCICGKPLLMVIPPGGIDLICPSHGKFHINGPPEVYC